MKSYSLKVLQIVDETPDAYTLILEKPQDEAFRYKAGQYLTVKLTLDGKPVRRAFSLSTSPDQPNLGITIKRIEKGLVSNYLKENLLAGQYLDVLPPMGKFCIEPQGDSRRHYVLIGGGSGITPLFAILKTVLKHEPQSKVTLWYGNRDLQHTIFYPQLSELAATHSDRLTVRYYFAEKAEEGVGQFGLLDTDNLQKLVHELFMQDELPKSYYLCGPEGLMQTAKRTLEAEGVYPENINQELYHAPAPTDEEVAAIYEKPAPKIGGDSQLITIKLDGETHVVPIQDGEYVLDAALNAGIDAPFACQAGVCTTCRAKLLSGRVEMDESEGLSAYELKQGFILTCQSRCVEGEIVVEYV